MMGKLFYTTLALGIIAFLVSFSVARHSEPGAHAIPPPAPANLYDSIRTDLSDYFWPTDAGRVITSTFAEYRRTHFHGGIDISTGNRTGYRVFAARDGYIARIGVYPNGYGKILYVRHYDGYYTTYAHLKHFAPEIDARVAREQATLERYPVTIECAPTEFRVHKGDVIAFTGETGVGTPHLHFEIRDENLNLVNPFLGENITAIDDIPPTFRRVAFTPLAGESFVDGGWHPQVVNARQVKGGAYRIAETVQLTGAIGLAVDVRDRSHGSHYRHGVYSHRLYIDDTLMYTVQLDRVPGRDAHQIGLYYDRTLLDRGRGRFEKLYMDSGNPLPFYEPKGDGAGILHTHRFAGGPHEFRIVSTDFNNNSSELTGNLILNHPPDFDFDQSRDSLGLIFDDISHITKIRLSFRRNSEHEWSVKTMTPEGYANGNLVDISYLRERADVVRVVAENAWGTRSFPQFHFIHTPQGPGGTLVIERDVESDFVRVIVRSNQPITSTPRLSVYEGSDRRSVSLRAIDIDEYTGTFRPQPATWACAGLLQRQR
jgi:murein DD-endopeptidase MepM/ murein hydrolase activator NlpD